MQDRMSGLKYHSELKEGWVGRFWNKGSIILVHPEHLPYMIALDSIKEGDVLPRDTDVPFEPIYANEKKD